MLQLPKTLLSAVRSKPRRRLSDCLSSRRGGIFSFNLTASSVIFRRVSSNNTASCIIQPFQRKRKEKDISCLGSGLYLFSLYKARTKCSSISGPVSQIFIIIGPLCEEFQNLPPGSFGLDLWESTQLINNINELYVARFVVVVHKWNPPRML